MLSSTLKPKKRRIEMVQIINSLLALIIEAETQLGLEGIDRIIITNLTFFIGIFAGWHLRAWWLRGGKIIVCKLLTWLITSKAG